MRITGRVLIFLALSWLWVVPAIAQVSPGGGGGVNQSGSVTNGNCTKWLGNNTVADAGGPCGGSGSPGGVSGQIQFNNAGSFGGTTTGSGVLSALGVNPGTAGSFVINGGALGTPSSGTLTSATGLPISTGLTGAGTGVLSALGSAINAAGGLVGFSGALGTPTSGTLTNATGLPIAGLSGLGTGVGTWLATPSSANLAAAVTGETGTGALVFGTAPTISSLNATTAATLAYITGSTQCLHVNTSGAISGTGSDCGSGSSGVTSIAGNTGAFTLNSASGLTNATNDIKCQVGSSTQFGCLKVDGTTITAAAGVISATTGGGGTVTSVGAGCGTSTGGSPITTTGNVSAAVTRRLNSTTTDAIVNTDCGNVVSESNASSIAVSIAQAGTTGFAAGAYFDVCNIGAGTATITPTTSTIGGAATLAIPGGSAAAPVCYAFQSDGTNYNLIDAPTVNAGLLSAGTLAAGRMPAYTGDVTSSAGATVNTLATVNSNVGSFGSSTAAGTFTVNAKGLITAAASTTITPALSSITGLGTGVATQLGNAVSTAGGSTQTIASGTATIPNTAISSGTCGSAITVAATNVATTDIVAAGFAADPTATTGFLPTAMLTIVPYPTSGNANFKVCNLTSSSITPTSTTINWRVTR